MKRNTLILILLVLAIGGVTYYLMNKDEVVNEKFKLHDERDFSIRNAGDVYHIMVANREGDVIKIDRKDGNWILNGKYIARDWSISNLLNSIRNIQIRSIPTEGELPYLIEAFKISAIKVVLRDKNNKIVNAFLIGPNSTDQTSSYFKKEDGRVYLCEIKNFVGSPRKVFQFSVPEYRSLDLILNKKNKIHKIIVNYPQFKSESFTMTKNGSSFTVERLYDFPKASTKLDQKLSESYYEQYDRIFGETYFNNLERLDTLLQKEPFATFTVVKGENDTISLSLWPTQSIVNIKAIDRIEGNPTNDSNIPRFWVHTSRGDWLKMQMRPNVGILRGYSYFFK